MMSQITLTFPDGNQKKFDKGITSQEVATSIAPSLAKKAISSSVNGQHFDLSWPIEEDAKIAINTIKDTEPALELVRHDLAHIMGSPSCVVGCPCNLESIKRKVRSSSTGKKPLRAKIL